MNRFLLLTIILLGTLSCTTDNRVYSLRNELIENGNSRFYKDFDIFSRKGIEEITSDTLLRPFFKVQIDIDSVILLTIFKKGEKAKEIIVPKDETMLYDFDDINDGPRHNYYKIFKDSLVVFGYDNKIDEVETWDRDSIFLFELLPRMISVMTRDTLYHYFQDCLNIKVMDEDDTEIKIAKSDFRKKSIQPFAISIDLNCNRCLIHYFDTTGYMRHYYRDNEDAEYLSRKNPGDGLYGYQKEFNYWRDHYAVD